MLSFWSRISECRKQLAVLKPCESQSISSHALGQMKQLVAEISRCPK